MQPPRIALIGLGRFGANHLRTWRHLSEEKKCQLVAVVDVDEKSLSSLDLSSLKVTKDLESAIHGCDAVDIVTPTDTHYAIAKTCLESGKDVFVEKPLTVTSREASELVQLAERTSRILAVGHILRYDSVVARIKSMVDARELGDITFLDGRYMGTKGPRLDSGVLLNLAIHLVDLYSFLLNEKPSEIVATCKRLVPDSRFDDHATLSLKYPSGAVGQITVSWLSASKIRDLVVGGKNGSIAANFSQSSMILQKTIQPVTIQQVQATEPLLAELSDFVECVSARGKPKSNANDGMLAIRVIEKAEMSSRTGRPIHVD